MNNPMKKGRLAVVLEQDTALTVYLDALLQDVPDFEPDVSSTYSLPAVLSSADIVIAEQSGSIAPDQPDQEQVQLESGDFPVWASPTFKGLLFKVDGVALVAPLSRLSSIVDGVDSIAAVPGYSKRLLGLLPYRGANVKIIDIGYLMAPENRHPHAEIVEKKTSRRVVLVDDASWGFICDEVIQALTLDRKKVRWRADSTHRPWMVGTVIEHMCVLLDVDKFSQELVG
ncbi:MAG: chemotaxis protein CheW [Gammaproteobacteria bacterium]